MTSGTESYNRFLQGDEKGLEELLRIYDAGLTAFLFGIVKNELVAGELAEETFVILCLKKPKYKGESSFKTWLYSIGRNIAVDYLRKESRHKHEPIYDYTEVQSDEAVEESYFQSEKRAIVKKAMEKLNPSHSQVLTLLYFENFSVREAAKIMKKSVHSVETTAYRARCALKTELEKGGFVYEEL